jgi:hypothetical protein
LDVSLLPLLVSLGLLGGMLVCLELGRRYGARHPPHEGEAAGLGVLDGAVVALLGLLIAFTFSSAANRFEQRRLLAVQESNDLGTAWLRLDLLPEGPRAELQQLFREYLDSRIETYGSLPDLEAAARGWAKSGELQGRIWARAREALQALPTNTAALLLIPALNSMFDTASARRAALLAHQPALIFAMLIALALCAAALVGHALAHGGHGRWLHTLAFALITSLTCYVILDLEFPSTGLIRLELANQLLAEVRAGMK